MRGRILKMIPHLKKINVCYFDFIVLQYISSRDAKINTAQVFECGVFCF